jgi:peptide methionine sulfoxide reductase MsrB
VNVSYYQTLRTGATRDVIDLQNVFLYSETYCSGTGPSYDNQVRCDLICGMVDRSDDIAYRSEERC